MMKYLNNFLVWGMGTLNTNFPNIKCPGACPSRGGGGGRGAGGGGGGGGGNVEMDACWAFIGGLPPPIALFHNDDI